MDLRKEKKKEKGSIAIFVLVALLFMSAFLIILYGSNVNKSKIVKVNGRNPVNAEYAGKNCKRTVRYNK